MPLSRIQPDGSLEKTAEILTDIYTQGKTLNIIFGNKFAPVPLLSWEDFLRQEKEIDPRIKPDEVKKHYWEYLEYLRFTTYNYLPLPNYFYLSLLIQKLPCNIITTNYDGFLESSLERSGIDFALNPCKLTTGEHPEWDRDRYYCSSLDHPKKVWKIHGSLSYIRFFGCDHIFRLPKYLLNYPCPQELESIVMQHLGITLWHYTACSPDGRLYTNSALREDHEIITYRHHIDWGGTTDIFHREFEAATQSIIESEEPVFVLGLSASDRHPEDIVPTLQTISAKGTTIIYMMPSAIPLKVEDSEILQLLVKAKGSFVFVNELTTENELVDVFMMLVQDVIGRENLYNEYRSLWRESERWLIP